MKSSSFSPLVWLLLSAVVAAGAGIVSAMVASRSMETYAARLLEERRFQALIPERSLERPGTFAEGIAKVRTDGFAAMASFYTTRDDAALPANWQASVDAVAQGVVISADGWVALPPGSAVQVGRHQAVVRGKRYALATRVEGPEGVVFVRLAEAAGLPVVSLGNSADMRSGDTLLAADTLQGIRIATLTQSRAPLPASALVLPAEVRAYAWRVSGAEPNTFLWATSGDVVGVVDASGTALPFHVLGDALASIVRGEQAAFAGLGAYVVDVQAVANPSVDLFGSRQSGALIIAPTPATRAVVKDGPADRAGLQAKDILLAVDGVAVHSESPLADILLAYAPGEVANITFARNGETLTVPVALGNAQDLVY